MLRVATISILLSLAFPLAAAVVEVSSVGDLTTTLPRLKPGDELVLRTGTYAIETTLTVANVGQPDRPIVIRSAQGEDVLLRSTASNRSLLELRGARHLVLRNVRLEGGTHAIRLVDADFVTIDGCDLAKTAASAIVAQAPGVHQGLVVRNTHIHDTGDAAIALGCAGSCEVANSVVEWNHIHHTAGSLVSLAAGSNGIVIRHNVMYASQRPGVVTAGTQGAQPNVVDSNLIFDAKDAVIRSAADLAVRNNILLGSPIVLRADDGEGPANHTIVHNTILTDGSAIVVARGVSGSIVIANNALYAAAGSPFTIDGNSNLVTLVGNVGSSADAVLGTGIVAGKGLKADFLRAHAGAVPPIDVFPREASRLIAAGSSHYTIELDFNGTARQGTVDAGAYRFQPGGNPGWTLAAGFKSKTNVRPKSPTMLSAE